jgi:hypothetical protein
MARYKMPFSGDVTQAFRMFTQTFSSVGSQFGFINIYNARSSAPDVEADVLEDVGSYGKQLGQIGDVMAILMARLPADTLSADERKAIVKLQIMLDDIAAIKKQHGREPFRVA